MSGLSGNLGYKLFMDNYYTTLKVIRMLYEQFKWLACGTVAMKKKKKKDSSIVADDYPWRKMTKGAVSFLKRGFFELQLEHSTPHPTLSMLYRLLCGKTERWLDGYIL